MTGTGWALITGAGSGIGAALARALDARGVPVILVGRRAAPLQAVAESLTRPAMLLPGDISRPEGRAAITGTVTSRNLALRALIHNAGIGDPAPDFARTDPALLERAFATNVTAPLALTQALLPALRQSTDARVMLLGAGIADHAQPGTGVYGITKAATARLMRQMAVDFDHEAVPGSPAVALFQPGLVDTEGLRAHVTAARACGLPHADWIDSRLAEGSAATPDTVARAMAHALIETPCADYHGQTLRPGHPARTQAAE